MFSMMMIASSTTTPRHKINAMSDIMLIVMPIICIAMIAPANATGSPIAAIVALRAPDFYASLLASVANYDDVLVSLTSQVATTYVAVRTFEDRIAIAQHP